jgi:hypothetical protein
LPVDIEGVAAPSPLRILSNHSFLKLLLDTSLQTLLVYDYALGSSPVYLSRHFAFTVWLCESEEEGARIRAAVGEAGCRGVSVVVADLAHLPFGSGLFDVVVAHRIQWRFASAASAAIAEIARQANSNGNVYVSLDFGAPKMFSPGETWSARRKLARCFRSSDLAVRARAFYYRNYSNPYFLRIFWAGDPRWSIRTRLERLKYDVTVNSTAYVCSRRKEDNRSFRKRTLVARLKATLEEVLGRRVGNPRLVRPGSGESSVVDFGNVIVRLPLTEAGDRRCANNFATISALKERSLPVAIPHPLARGSIEDQQYYAESRLPGLSMDLYRISREQVRAVEEQAFSLLLSRELVVTGSLGPVDLLTRLESEVYRLKVFLREDNRRLVAEVARWAKSKLTDCSVPVVVVHGDFKKSNFLVSGKAQKKLTGVIDWDLSELRGLPLVDALTLRACSVDPQGLYVSGLRQIVFRGEVDDYLTRYCRTMRIGQTTSKILLSCALLKHLNAFPEEEKRDTTWQCRLVDEGALSILEAVPREETQYVISAAS